MKPKKKGAPQKKGVRFYSAHASKGSESKHILLIDVVAGLYGFPCEIQDSSVLDIARRFKSKSFIEEERRLFYVALTRSERFLYVFTIQNNESIFIEEIEPFTTNVLVDFERNWDSIVNEVVPLYIKGKLGTQDYPLFCPDCGRILTERTGKYGKFLGCTGYPECKYIYDIKKDDDILCPDCGRRLILKEGRYGKFLGCIGYPNCKFTFNLEGKSKKKIYCPKCKNKLNIRKGKYGKFLECSRYPNCNYTYKFI